MFGSLSPQPTSLAASSSQALANSALVMVSCVVNDWKKNYNQHFTFTILTHSFAKTDYTIIRITTKLKIIDLGSNDEQGGFWVQCFQSFDHMCSINVRDKMYTGAGSVWLQSFSHHQRTLCQTDEVRWYISNIFASYMEKKFKTKGNFRN